MKRGSEVRLPSHLGHGSLSLFVRKAPNSALQTDHVTPMDMRRHGVVNVQNKIRTLQTGASISGFAVYWADNDRWKDFS
jgi:hypothetical protein